MTRLLRRCHLPLLALLSFCQPLMVALYPSAPEFGAALSLYPLLLALMLPLCAAVRGRVRPVVLGACMLVLGACGYACFAGSAAAFAMPAGCAAILLFALSHADKTPADASPMFYLGCILGQLLALFIAHYMGVDMPAQRGAFCLWMPVFLLVLNRISLNNATLARYRLSEGMARAGTLLTLCVFALAVLLCALPAVVSGVTWLFLMLRDAGIGLLYLLVSLIPSESSGGMGGAPMPMLLPMDMIAEQPTSPFAIALEKIATAFSMIVLVVGTALLIRLICIALKRLIVHLLARLQRYAAAVSEDYEDEITDTRAEEGERSFHLLRRRARQTYPDTPQGRIRRRYAQLRNRHPAWADSSTARENLPEHTAALYERARYSDHVLSPDDAQRFEQETR